MAKSLDIKAWRAGRRRGRSPRRMLAAAVAACAVPVVVALATSSDGLGRIEALLDPIVQPAQLVTASFPICNSSRRITCVVDGDTIWLDGTKIRIADIDAPEIGQPRCAAEARRGAAARDRLAELLSAGPFEVRPADRDEDRYGRKLRILVRDGASVADDLVARGLAGYWGSGPQRWC
jgi:micrococcal nuclease